MPSPSKEFEIDPETYDTLVDWPRRLANEEPFYRQLFEQTGVERVLDAACGTGHHAAMFHAWGLRVEGADVTPAMVDHCRSRYGEREGLRWRERSFADPQPEPGSFDAVICVGNSLALAPDRPTAWRGVAMMLESLRSGGVCIVQVRNVFSMPEGPATVQRCVEVPRDNGRRVLLKSMHRVGSVAYVSFVDLRLVCGELEWASRGGMFLGLRDAELREAVEAGGGDDIELFGTFQREPFDTESSKDLILVCRRRS